MKSKLRILLVLLVALTMIMPTGLGYAVTNDEAASQQGDPAIKDIDPDTLNVPRLGQNLDLESMRTASTKAYKSMTITLDEIAEMDESELDQKVRVSIFMDQPAVLDRYSIEQYQNNKADSFSRKLKTDQLSIEQKINKAIGKKLKVKWRFTLALNAISAEVSYRDIAKILKVKGVESVERERIYYALEGENTAQPNTYNTSSAMVGATAAWDSGYTGAGSKIAIIDTGADTTHQSFDPAAFEYSLEKTGKDVDLLTEEEVNDLADKLTIADDLDGSGNLYVNSKIPFGFNYADKNYNILHIYDQQGEHGSHVSGIAAANRYIPRGDGFADAIDPEEEVFAVGMAPDAQLIEMKVFGASGGASDSDYMAAIQDAITLGCDACNLSLGSAEPGFSFYTYSSKYQTILNNLSKPDSGMVVSMSAGNAGAWPDYNPNPEIGYGELWLDDINMNTLGSPASYINSISVASADNIGETGKPLTFNGELNVFYTGDNGTPDISTFAGNEYEYVYIDAIGTPEDYAAANEAVTLEGKVLIVNRGGLNFSVKGNNAIPYNPVALIVANSEPGSFGMNVSGFTGTFPMVSISQQSGQDIINSSEPVEAEVGCYTGTMTASDQLSAGVQKDLADAEVSSFSSWGIPGALTMKPEITAPGGSIYSVNGTNHAGGGSDQYELMSGTSMAAPHIAGLSGVLLQYLKENDLTEKNAGLGDYSTRAIAQSLLMSTAVPMQPDGYQSILQQGAGLADVSKAVNAGSVIMMKDAGLATLTEADKDGKVKVELGEDPDKEGSYTYEFTIYNTEDVDESFTFRTDMFTQGIYYGYFMDRATVGLDADVSYTWTTSADEESHDVDKDGDTDKNDAQAILDYLTGENDGSALDLAAGEMDNDSKLSTKDAQILLGWVKEKSETCVVPANGSADVTVSIDLDKDQFEDYVNGAYIEGFTYAECTAETEDGEDLSHEHSIPILGFFGNWTDASMFDKISYVDAVYELMAEYGADINEIDPADINDYYAGYNYSENYFTNLMTITKDGKTTEFTGNPYAVEEEFPAERLAISEDTEITDFIYNLIRPAGTVGYVASLIEDEHISAPINAKVTSGDDGEAGLYYDENRETYYNKIPKTVSVNELVKDYELNEGDTFRAGLYAVPEYYAMLLNYYGYQESLNNTYSGTLDDQGLAYMVYTEMMGDGSYIGYDLTVDNTEPVIDKANTVFNKETNELTIKAEDNQNIAYVAVMTVDGETVYFEDVPADPEAEYTVDISEAVETAEGWVAVFVGDYAQNESAVALKVNENGEEGYDPTVAESVVVTPAKTKVYVDGKTNLNAKVVPITAADKTVTWTSEDESIASVNEYGTVTGVKVGTTVIRATSNANAEAYGECEVEVVMIEKDLSGIVYDADSKIYFSDFNTGDLMGDVDEEAGELKYEPKSEEPMEHDFTTAFNYFGDIFSGTLDLDTATSELYWVDPSDAASPEKIGDIGSTTEGGQLYALDTALGMEDYIMYTPFAYTYGPYLIMGNLEPDPEVGDNYSGELYALGYFGDVIGSDTYLAGLALKGFERTLFDDDMKAFYQDMYGGAYDTYFGDDRYNAPVYFILGDNGKIWQTKAYQVMDTIETDEGEMAIPFVEFTEPKLVIDTKIQTQITYQSLYYDGEYLYWSHFADVDSPQYLYIIDIDEDEETGEIKDAYFYKAGDFGDNVWPVSGLYEEDAVAGIPYSSISHKDTASKVDIDSSLKADVSAAVLEGKDVDFEAINKRIAEAYKTIASKKFLQEEEPEEVQNETELNNEEPAVTEEVPAEEPEAEAEVTEVQEEAAQEEPAQEEVTAEEPAQEEVAEEPVQEETAEEETVQDEVTEEAVQEEATAEEPAEDTPETQEAEDPAESEELVVDEASGSLNAVTGGRTVTKRAVPTINAPVRQKAEATSTEEAVQINLSEEEATTNGLVTVTYDPKQLTYTGASSDLDYKSIHVDKKNGKVVFAYASIEEIAEETVLASISFKAVCTDAEAIATVSERNAELDLEETSKVALKGLGHDWRTPKWTWAKDYSKATAAFTCGRDASHTKSLKATPTVKTTVKATCTKDGTKVYTAKVTLDGKTYTSKKTVTVAATGHKYGEYKLARKATNKHSGKLTKTCTKCGKKVSTNVGPVLAKAKSLSTSKAKISWYSVNGAQRYQVLFAKCSSTPLTKVVATTTNQSFIKTGLTKQGHYKFRVLAQRKIGGEWVTISQSCIGHFVVGDITRNGRSNAASVTLNKEEITLSVGKTATVKATVNPVKEGKEIMYVTHTSLVRFQCTNTDIATVDENGKITAVKAGTCYVSAIAPNGVWKSVKVIVK